MGLGARRRKGTKVSKEDQGAKRRRGPRVYEIGGGEMAKGLESAKGLEGGKG